MTYQRGTRKFFVASSQVFVPQNVEGTLPFSSAHKQMLSPQDVEGALPSSSTQQVQVQQLNKGKEKLQEEDLDDEQEREFELEEHDEPQQLDTEIIDLEAQERETIKDIIIQKKEAHIQALMDNLERAKFVITYLE